MRIPKGARTCGFLLVMAAMYVPGEGHAREAQSGSRLVPDLNGKLDRLPRTERQAFQWQFAVLSKAVETGSLGGEDPLPGRFARHVDEAVAAPAPSCRFGNILFFYNRAMGLAFNLAPLELVSLYGFEQEHEFLADRAGIASMRWDARQSEPGAKGSSKRDRERVDASAFSVRSASAFTGGGKELTLTGECERDGEKISLEIRVAFRGEYSRSFWTVSTRFEREVGSLEIAFPSIDSLGGISLDSKDDYVVIGNDKCDEPRRYVKRVETSRPAVWLIAYCGTEGGLYVAPRDGSHCYKSIGFGRRGRGFAAYVTNFAPARTSAHRPTYETEIGPFTGTWLDAAKAYRQWAVTQAWCAKGPLEERADLTDSVKYDAFSIWFHGNPWLTFETCMRAKDYFMLPFTSLDYVYFRYYYNDNEPLTFPPKPGTHEYLKRMRREQLQVMNYINGRIWDVDTPEWTEKRAEDGTVLTRDARRKYSNYCKFKQRFSVMCPFTRLQSDVLCSEVKARVQAGYTSQYLDQVGQSPTIPCHDPNHGHVPGPGSHWNEGYRAILKRMIDENRTTHPDFHLMTEGIQENYIGLFDLRFEPFYNNNCVYLKAPQEPDSQMRCRYGFSKVPTFEVVYHPYVMTTGSILFLNQGQFGIHQATSFIWGHKPMLNWQGRRWDDYVARSPGFMAFFKRLAEKRLVAKKYLVFGSLEDLIELDTARVDVRWSDYYNRRTLGTTRCPAVVASVWRASDGTIGVALANHTAEPQKYRCSVAPSDYGMRVESVRGRSLFGTDGGALPSNRHGASIVVEGTVAALDADVLELSDGRQRAEPAAFALVDRLRRKMQESTHPEYRKAEVYTQEDLLPGSPVDVDVEVVDGSGARLERRSINWPLYHIEPGQHTVRLTLRLRESVAGCRGELRVTERPKEIDLQSQPRWTIDLGGIRKSQTIDAEILHKGDMIDRPTCRALLFELFCDGHAPKRSVDVILFLEKQRVP